MTPPRGMAGPLLRALLRSPVAGTAVAVAAPAVITVVRGGRDLALAATFMLVAGSAALSLGLDEPTGPTLDACPVTRNSRHLARTALVGLAIAIAGAAVAVLAGLTGAHLGSIRSRLPESVAAAMISLSVAAARSRSDKTPGLAAALGTVLAMVTVTGLSAVSPRLHRLPQIANPHHASRWWAIAAAAAACLWWSARDPAHRHDVKPACRQRLKTDPLSTLEN